MSARASDSSADLAPAPVMRPSPSFLPFAPPDIGEAEIAAVVECLRSGWLTTGPRVEEFERRFAHMVRPGAHALAVNSATAGLHLALEALDVGPGDEVIVPDYNFTASAEVVRHLGADPVFVDVDPHTLNVTADAMEQAVTSRTKVLLPVHFAGLACDVGAILAMARRRGLAVVDDAAHALPSTIGGELVGSFDTDASVFSFYATKTLCTGEGGMVVTGRADIAARCAIMRLHGINRDVSARYVTSTPKWHYEVLAPGFKYNLTDIAAAIGLVQLDRLHDMTKRRTEIAEQYVAAFADLPLLLPGRPAAGDQHAWHLFVVRLTDEAPVTRDAYIDQMFSHGIGCSVHFIPMHRHPYWRDRYGLRPDMFPIAERAYQGAVSLPIYSGMSPEDVDRVIGTVRLLLEA